MSPKIKDESSKSLPSYKNIKVECLDRQVNVRKATLGEKLHLMKIFSGWIGELTKAGQLKASDKKELTTEEQNSKMGMKFLTENLPVVLEMIGNDYAIVLTVATDLKPDDIERLTNLKELVMIFKTIWEINSFEKDLVEVGKVLGDLGLGVTLAPKA